MTGLALEANSGNRHTWLKKVKFEVIVHKRGQTEKVQIELAPIFRFGTGCKIFSSL